MDALPFRLGILALACALRLAAAETTYGETHAVPKQESPSQSGGSQCPRDGESGADDRTADRDPDEGSGGEGSGEFRFENFDIHGGLRGTCFSLSFSPGSLQSLGFALIALPLWYGACTAGYAFVQGPAHLAFGNDSLQAFDRPAWRVSGGLDVGAAWIPKTSGGPGAALHAEVTGPVSQGGALELRARGAAAASLQGMDVDFERAVFEDGKPSGIEIDRMREYSASAYPLTAELLWHPGRKGFYLGAGGGAALRRETIDFNRSTPVPGGGGPHELSRDSWLPVAAAAMGRDGLDAAGRPRWYFEIRAETQFLRPARRSSFPSDNAASAFSLAWVWGWYL